MKLSGGSDSMKTNSDTVAPSATTMNTEGVAAASSGLVKPTDQTVTSSGVATEMNTKGVATASSGLLKPNNKTVNSSGVNLAVGGKVSASSAAKGKKIISEVLTFKDLTIGPHEGEVRFRLIHFWEAWNAQTKVLIGLELLLIDEEETVIQGFIPCGRIDTYVRHLRAGSTYRLNNFFGSKSKVNYSVAEASVTLSFSWNSVLSVLEESSVRFSEDRFRFHREFEANCDKRGDLYDYLGHIKVVNVQVPSESLVLEEAEIRASRRVELHVQTHDDPVLKLYLWDKAAFEFCEKHKASGGTSSVILVTTLNPKRFGGVLSLASMASSRVFMDSDVQDTRAYLSWLNSNLDVANRVNAEVVTKPETMTLGDLFSYMKQASAKVAWFECKATIDDVVHGAAWYYIGCGVCHTKATKGPTTLMCKKCGKSEIVGVPQYLSKFSVYDHNDQAIFVVLGDAGEKLIGQKAAQLVESYFEANENIGEDHIVPVPQALMGAIGQTRKFIVKVSNHNLTGKTQALTVTKVLPIEPPEPEGNLVENENVDEEPENGGQPENGGEDHAEEPVKRGADGIESSGGKRAKCG